jgi:hypothetical protein
MAVARWQEAVLEHVAINGYVPLHSRLPRVHSELIFWLQLVAPGKQSALHQPKSAWGYQYHALSRAVSLL